jgi:hypothetical protein
MYLAWFFFVCFVVLIIYMVSLFHVVVPCEWMLSHSLSLIGKPEYFLLLRYRFLGHIQSLSADSSSFRFNFSYFSCSVLLFLS